MDLLTGYGSSEDEQDDHNDDQNDFKGRIQQPQGVEACPMAPENGALGASSHLTTTAPTRTAPPGTSRAGVREAADSSSRPSRIRKKMLSLAAVLPPHILEQLSQALVRGEDDDDDDDENLTTEREEDEEVPRSFSTDASSSAHRPHQDGKTSSGPQSQKVARLLSALHAQKPAMAPGQPPVAERLPSRRPVPPAHEPLGAAFLSSTTIVADRQREGVTSVRNIHAASDEPEVEDLLSCRPVNESTTAASSSFLSSMRINPAPDPTPRRFVRPPVVLAPPIPAPSVEAAMALSTDHNDNLEPEPSVEPDPTAPPNVAEAVPRKRSRKEMERALRKGDWSTWQPQDFTASLQQADPDQYQPEPDHLSQAIPRHGIKVVPTAMYDPSAGQSVVGMGGKGRGKNQINHLLASAANLELQRARAPNAMASHRANAKQKYGW